MAPSLPRSQFTQFVLLVGPLKFYLPPTFHWLLTHSTSTMSLSQCPSSRFHRCGDRAWLTLAELSEARAQADSLGNDNCPSGQRQGLGRRDPRETQVGPDVPELLLQLMQPPQSICLDLAPTSALLGAELRGQGQAAGSCRNLLLH